MPPSGKGGPATEPSVSTFRFLRELYNRLNNVLSVSITNSFLFIKRWTSSFGYMSGSVGDTFTTVAELYLTNETRWVTLVVTNQSGSTNVEYRVMAGFGYNWAVVQPPTTINQLSAEAVTIQGLYTRIRVQARTVNQGATANVLVEYREGA